MEAADLPDPEALLELLSAVARQLGYPVVAAAAVDPWRKSAARSALAAVEPSLPGLKAAIDAWGPLFDKASDYESEDSTTLQIEGAVAPAAVLGPVS